MSYRIIPFIRIEPETDEYMELKEALREKEQLQVMHPDNIYVIEDENGVAVDNEGLSRSAN